MSDLFNYIQSASASGMTPNEIAGSLLNAGWRMDHLVAHLSAWLSPRPEIAISAQGITKSFGKIQALAGVDITVASGSITALLGPNGAGKTTLVRILATLLSADGGSANVSELDVLKNPQEVRALIGLTGQFTAVDGVMTGRETLEMVGRLYHLSRDESRRRTEELLINFDLMDAADRLVKTYSGGMKRRLDVAASLINRPRILFLDEPTTGLDPHSRLTLWEIIKDLAVGGTTILLTTQYLEEADKLADKIIVMDRGRIIAEGTTTELKNSIGGDFIQIHLENHGQLIDALRAIATFTREVPRVDEEAGIVVVPTRRGAADMVATVRALDNSRVMIADISLRRPTLDDVFLSLTGHEAQEQSVTSVLN